VNPRLFYLIWTVLALAIALSIYVTHAQTDPLWPTPAPNPGHVTPTPWPTAR